MYLLGGTELTADGSSTSAVRYYSFAGRTVAARTGRGSSGTTTVVADHQGTGVVQVDQSSNTLSRRYSDPYGGTRKGTAWTGDHGFLDKPTDSTGLVQVGARYYDPALGRFISVDPVMDLSDPQQWNAYSYGNNNPVTWSDPTGKLPIGAGMWGYNPRVKDDPNKYNRCRHAISCEKDVRRGGKIVRVRENYTDHAVDFFSKSKNKTTKYTVNKAHTQDGARAEAKARGAAAKDAAERAAAARAAEQKKTEQASQRSWWRAPVDRPWGKSLASGVNLIVGSVNVAKGYATFRLSPLCAYAGGPGVGVCATVGMAGMVTGTLRVARGGRQYAELLGDGFTCTEHCTNGGQVMEAVTGVTPKFGGDWLEMLGGLWV